MSAESNKTVEPNESQNTKIPVDESRRSFAKVGVGIFPVMMTLANRSAWGANACLGSGFQSYSQAVDNNVVLSHAATNRSTNLKWKKPRSGLPATTTGDGWLELLSSWPAGIIPVSHKSNPADRYEKWDGSKWTGNYKYDDARQLGIVFIDQLFSGGSATQTIYEALHVETLLAYQIATEFNRRVNTADTPLPSLISLADYELFYSECVM